MSPVATRLIGLLEPHTPFAEAIVRRQAERAGLRLEELDLSHIEKIGPDIVRAAAVFVDPPVLARIKRALDMVNR
jgi:hypothetical protein